MLKLFEYAYFPNFEEGVKALSVLADEEKWCFANDGDEYSILKNYLEHTFRRIQYEKKILTTPDKSHFVFNTGLFTSNLEEIYALFSKHKSPPENNPTQKFFCGFKRHSDIQLIRLFEDLPRRANYFESPEHLIFDPNKNISVNIDHIIDDNINRLPKQFQGNKNLLYMLLNGAIEKSKKLATLDYKIAIPQCYNNQIQLLLPLFMSDERVPDSALALSHINASYRASTILTLRMAYNNARLIVKPQSNWLSPQSVS